MDRYDLPERLRVTLILSMLQLHPCLLLETKSLKVIPREARVLPKPGDQVFSQSLIVVEVLVDLLGSVFGAGAVVDMQPEDEARLKLSTFERLKTCFDASSAINACWRVPVDVILV